MLQEPLGAEMADPGVARARGAGPRTRSALDDRAQAVGRITAREAVDDELAAQEEQIEALEEEVAAAEQAASSAQDEATQTAGDVATAEQAAQSAQEALDQVNTANAAGTPFDFRIPSSVAAGASDAVPFPVPDGQVLSITDIQFQNPRGDGGTIQIRRNADVILEFGLGNFRDYDYHVVTPLRFDGDDEVILFVQCDQSTTGTCTPSAFSRRHRSRRLGTGF